MHLVARILSSALVITGIVYRKDFFMRNGDIAEVLFQLFPYLDIYEYGEVLKNNSHPLNSATPDMLLKIFVERAINKSGLSLQVAQFTESEHAVFFKQAMLMARATSHYYALNQEFHALIEKKSA